MDAQLVITDDGSHTLYVPDLKEHYHSHFGALAESNHVFIHSGLAFAEHPTPVNLFEAGFGTGLNAFLSLAFAEKMKIRIRYTAVEPEPLGPELWRRLNYPLIPGFEEFSEDFLRMHEMPEGEEGRITPHFTLTKLRVTLEEAELPDGEFGLVYFDAFGPDVQPELWTEDIFRKIAKIMKLGGVLVTYSAKGSVRRALKASGFAVEKLPGPPGKREITRAVKKVQSTKYKVQMTQ
jgi:tRNA U34 5-methylaminomethyl-2-thiouridine-forming methyltransferase MnmC